MPGRPDPPRLRSLSPLLLILVTAVVAACIGESGTPAPTLASVATPEPSVSVEPSTASIAPSPSSSPSDAAPPSPVASASPSLAPADAVEACTGTDDNRAFFADAAEDLDWSVYCPALPARWFVSTGSYSRVGEGRLTISYKGPSGATLSLHEGAFCDDGDGCVAAGTDAGEAAFSDQTGTLVVLDDGGYAIVVARGASLSWLAIATGLDEAAFREIAAAFVRLD
jgi:hypothetical protein